MTSPDTGGAGGQLGTVFINVAPKISGLANQFLAAGREGAKSFSQGFTEGMKNVSLPADGSILGEVIAGKPVGTATKTAAQKAGKVIGEGLNTGVAEGMKTAPPTTGGGAMGDVLAGKPVGSATKSAAENLGKEIGKSVSKGVEDSAKDTKLDEVITKQVDPEATGDKIGKTIGAKIGDSLKAAADAIGPEGGAAIGEALGQAIAEGAKQIPGFDKFAETVNKIRDAAPAAGDALNKVKDAINATKAGDLADALGKANEGLQGLEPIAGRFGVDISGWTGPLNTAVPKLQEMATHLKGAFAGDVATRAQGILGLIRDVEPFAKNMGVDLGPVADGFQKVAETATQMQQLATDVKGIAEGLGGITKNAGEAEKGLGTMAATGQSKLPPLITLLGEVGTGLVLAQQITEHLQSPQFLGDAGAAASKWADEATGTERDKRLTWLLQHPIPKDQKGFTPPAPGSYAAGGMAKGTDTVPAMLTPGEYIVRADKAAKHRPMLDAINYYADGGPAGQSPYTGQTGVLQVIWNNTATGQKIGEAAGQYVGPGTSQPGYYGADWSGHTGHVHTSFATGPDGTPYGLPVGSDVRQGRPGFPSWVYALGSQYGLDASTYPGHQESSGRNRGIDWWPHGHADMSGASYTADERQRLTTFAQAMASAGAGFSHGGAAPAAWGSLSGSAASSGPSVSFGSGSSGFPTAMTAGMPGGPAGVFLSGLASGFGLPTGIMGGDVADDTGQVYTVPLVQLPDGRWTSPDPAWAHLIQRESGGSPRVPNLSDINAQRGDPSVGLFQITGGTWRSHGGTQFAPSPGEATPQQQALIAARILMSNPSGGDWGAGMSGRESASGLMAGLTPLISNLPGGTAGAMGSATNPMYIAAKPDAIEPSTKTGTADVGSQYLQQFGAAIPGGLFQEAGFGEGGPFGKPPTQWGLFKMGMVALNYGMGLAKAGGGMPGSPASLAAAVSGRPGAAAPAGLGGPGPTTINQFDLSNGLFAGAGAAKDVTNLINPSGPASSATPPSTGAAGFPS